MPPRHVIGLYDLDNGRNGEAGHWRGDNGAAWKGEKGAATTLRKRRASSAARKGETMRNGFKVWDTDTHLHPSVETLEQYFDASMKARLPELESFKVPGRTGGDFTPRDVAGWHQYRFPGQIAFKRILGHAEPPAVPVNNYGKFMGAVFPAAGTADDQVDTRISEMDREGVDVQLLVPGVPILEDDPEMEAGFIRAYNRFINDLCTNIPSV
jgi:hypothetical protein